MAAQRSLKLVREEKETKAAKSRMMLPDWQLCSEELR
jgi:hypothetical protein